MIPVLLTLLVLGPQAQEQRPAPEGTIIGSVYVSGFDMSRFSPGLRQDIRALIGTPLKQERLDELVTRIDDERPRRVAAVRADLDADGQARVTFIVGDRDQDNVNNRYIVDRVEIEGIEESALSDELRAELQTLVGRRLDWEQADRLRERMEDEKPRYEVSRRTTRAGEPGHIRVIYDFRKKEAPAWLRFEPLRANLIFHSEQGWGSLASLGIGDDDIRFTPTIAIDNGDDLIEEYSGYGLRFETRRMGTRRLGASLEWSSYEPTWRPATVNALAANPAIPGLYDTRSTIAPLVKFAITPELNVSAGLAITELDPFAPGDTSRMSNAAVGSIDFRKWLDSGPGSQRIDARFLVRGGSRSLESDFAYTRYLADGSYRYDLGRHHVAATGMVGGITGTAPLFERFSLGDSTTLRGWDKYDIAPAGATRMFHASIEYHFTGVGVLLDFGSLWDPPAENKVRVSTGLSFRAGPAFATIGFPLNTDNLTAVFTMGLRFSESPFRW